MSKTKETSTSKVRGKRAGGKQHGRMEFSARAHADLAMSADVVIRGPKEIGLLGMALFVLGGLAIQGGPLLGVWSALNAGPSLSARHESVPRISEAALNIHW